jgi:hypothetical protein
MASKFELKQEYIRLMQTGKSKDASEILKKVQNFSADNTVSVSPRKTFVKKSKKSK